MAFRCPECGGASDDADGCWATFGALLALEFVDEAYGKVHHLTVATYMLQHPTRLSRRGWFEMRGLLRLHLREGVSVEGLRRRIRAAGVDASKGWKMKADGTCCREAVGLAWPLTIADIAADDRDGYAERVTAWALAALDLADEVAGDR